MPDRLRRKLATHHSRIWLRIQPDITRLPLPIQRYDDPFLPFGRAVIAATRDLVSAYVFDFAAYLALGAAGVVALERTIATVQGAGEPAAVLDAPFARAEYATAASASALSLDGVTITQAQIAPAFAQQEIAALCLHTTVHGSAAWYDPAGDLAVVDGITYRVLGSALLYASRGDDFAERLRAAIQVRT
jgi:hypothetical protein